MMICDSGEIFQIILYIQVNNKEVKFLYEMDNILLVINIKIKN